MIYTGAHTQGYLGSLTGTSQVVLRDVDVVNQATGLANEPIVSVTSTTAVVELLEGSTLRATGTGQVLGQTSNSSFSTGHTAYKSDGTNRFDASLTHSLRPNRTDLASKTWDWWRANVPGATGDQSGLTLGAIEEGVLQYLSGVVPPSPLLFSGGYGAA